MYDDDELLQISALQHLAFCERQWGLIYLENLWVENILTAEGRNLHERVDSDLSESRGDIITSHGLRVKSSKLGLTGRTDVVEFHRIDTPDDNSNGVRLKNNQGLWRPFPIEYKRGKPKIDRSDEIQLCAQALCLEEMLGVRIEEGALYYGKPRKRTSVSLDISLRTETVNLIDKLRRLTQLKQTPSARYEKKCRNCSLVDLCLPKATSVAGKVHNYIDGIINE